MQTAVEPGRFVSVILIIIALLCTICNGTEAWANPVGSQRVSANVSVSKFGTDRSGHSQSAWVLRNKNGMSATIITYGATLIELLVPDKHGRSGNVVLGFDNLAQYENQSPYFGATIGRYANRIAGAAFDLDGKHYELAANNGPNTLHGGAIGFDKKTWTAEPLVSAGDKYSVKFSRLSADGEEGFPGEVRASVTYTLTDDNKLVLEYSAKTSKATPLNLTNHAYFNLSGAGHESILHHKLQIEADSYTPVDESLIPTGLITPVTNTPMDFSSGKLIGDDIQKVSGGYDHNFVIRGNINELKQAAKLEDHDSGRIMTMFTTEPGVQFYSGNFLDGTISGNGGLYRKHSALCLEAQHFPDSPHHPNFPTAVLSPGQEYKQTTIYAFSTAAP